MEGATPFSFFDQSENVFFFEAIQRAESHAHVGTFDRVVVIGMLHVDLLELHAVPLGIHDERARGVKAHRLRIEQRSHENFRVMFFEVAARVSDDRETRGVALGKSVRSEADNGLVNLFGVFDFNSVIDHAVDQALS